MANMSRLTAAPNVTGGEPILTIPVAQRIIDRVSAGLSLSVSVTTTTAEVLASTEPDLVGAQSPVAAALLAGVVSAPGAAGRLLAYADRTVGAIVLHEADPESPVLQVARTLAELIIHQLVVLDQLPHRRWARDKFLDDLLHDRLGGSPDAILHQAAVLGVDLAPPRLVALVDLAGLPPPPAPAEASSLQTIDHRRRVARAQNRLVEFACALVATHANDLCACLGDRWLAILPAIPAGAEDGMRTFKARLEALLSGLAAQWHFETRAGMGRPCTTWAELSRSFREACFALEVGPALGSARRILTTDSLGLAGLVCQSDAGAKHELAGRLLAPLDDEPELLATLAVFLRVDLAPSQAARELSVHRHTLSYRLDKIAALTGHDPRRFSDAAQLYAALLLRRAGAPALAPTAPRPREG